MSFCHYFSVSKWQVHVDEGVLKRFSNRLFGHLYCYKRSIYENGYKSVLYVYDIRWKWEKTTPLKMRIFFPSFRIISFRLYFLIWFERCSLACRCSDVHKITITKHHYSVCAEIKFIMAYLKLFRHVVFIFLFNFRQAEWLQIGSKWTYNWYDLAWLCVVMRM